MLGWGRRFQRYKACIQFGATPEEDVISLDSLLGKFDGLEIPSEIQNAYDTEGTRPIIPGK